MSPDAAGGVVAQDPVVGGDQRNAEHQRDRKLHPLAERGIRHVERRTVAGADARRADHAGQERSRNASRQRAIGQRGNPEMPSANHSSSDDEHVVEQRPECRQKKQPVREQDCRDDAADVKEDLCGQQNAGQMDSQVHLRGREAVKHPAHELRREDFGEDGAHDHDRSHDRDDDGKGFLRVGIALLREKSRIDRDEGDRSRAPGHDVVEPVGQREGGDVGVGLRACAEGVGDVGLADVADHAREHDRRHQQQRGREGRVLVRGTKEPQKSGHGPQIYAGIVIPNKRSLRREGSGRAARSVAFFATQESRVGLASLSSRCARDVNFLQSLPEPSIHD